jgi:hypothetical protein
MRVRVNCRTHLSSSIHQCYARTHQSWVIFQCTRWVSSSAHFGWKDESLWTSEQVDECANRTFGANMMQSCSTMHHLTWVLFLLQFDQRLDYGLLTARLALGLWSLRLRKSSGLSYVECQLVWAYICAKLSFIFQ